MSRRRLPEEDSRSLRITIRFKPGVEAVILQALAASGCNSLSHFVRAATVDYVKRYSGVQIEPPLLSPSKESVSALKQNVRAGLDSQLRPAAENYSQAPTSGTDVAKYENGEEIPF